MNTDWTIGLQNALMLCDLSQWISLAHGMARHGKLHRFEWCGNPNGTKFERLLRTYDIHVYGRFCQIEMQQRPDGNTKTLRRWCHVNQRQAEWTEYLLCCAMVPLESTPVNQANWKAWGKRMPRPWTSGVKTVTMTERFLDFLDQILP